MPLRALPFLLVLPFSIAACSKGGGGGATGGGSGAQGGGTGGTSSLALTWSFDGRSCAQQSALAADAGVPEIASVTVELNGQTYPATGGYGCTNGAAGDGVTISNIAEGATSLTVHARSAQGEALFTAQDTVNVSGATSRTVTLHALKGGLALRWHFWNGTDSLTCADAGVSNLTFNLLNGNNNTLVYGDAGTTLPCPSRWGEGVQVSWLEPGRYFVLLRGRDASNTLYGSDPFSPPHADVDAGVFPSLEDTSLNVELYAQ